MLPKCKYCGRGWLLTPVSKEGLCNNCRPVVAMSVERSMEIVRESEKIINNTKKFETKIGRYETLIRTLYNLDSEYYSKGIPVLTKPPQEVIHQLQEERKVAIHNEAESQVNKHLDKATVAKTVNSKINNANKALFLLKDFDDKYEYKNLDLEEKVNYFIFRAELDDYIDKAEKAAFKEQNKKAIDLYMDALYHLKNSEFEENEIQVHIEKEISELKDQA